jgi:hypothetical protein
VELNNRELAVLVWAGVAVLVMLVPRTTRHSLGEVAKAFAHPKVLVTTLGLAVCTAGLCAAAAEIGLWDPDLLKETVIWFLGVGFGLMMNMSRAFKEDDFFIRAIRRTVGITLLVEFFINVAVLPFLVELLLAPAIVFLVLMSQFAAREEETRVIKPIADGCLSVIGLGLFLFVAVKVLTDVSGFLRDEPEETLLLPVWLTSGVLPYVYLLGLWSSYQQNFRFIDQRERRRWPRTRAKLALVSVLKARARDVDRFRLPAVHELTEAGSWAAACRVAREFRVDLRRSEKAEREYRERLKRFAGVEGVDEAGRPLDRREFRETTAALRSISDAMFGWYSNHDRYDDEFVSLLEPFKGLPADHGIELRIADNGQAWYCWRRTVGGWCFATGAAGPPPDEQIYDGGDPPSGFPRSSPGWQDAYSEDAPNWAD